MKNFLVRYRFPVVLTLSILCIAAVVGLTRHYFVVKERELRAKIDKQTNALPVVVAQRDLPAGTRLDANVVAMRPIPEAFIPPGAITPKNFSGVAGMILSEPLPSGKPLLRHYIKGIAHAEKFSDLLQPGQRALTLQVDGVSSVEHMMESGDFIDLGVKSKKGEIFELLLERVLVLSTGNLTTADPKTPGMYKRADYSTITLGVDDSYVQKILEAENRGELIFLLRNERDELAARYSSHKEGRQILVYAGRKADSGVLTEVSEAPVVEASVGEERSIRNRNGRILRKSFATTEPIAEVKNTEEVVKRDE